MLVIRLARSGRNKYPTYRIVAAESSRPATGKMVELLGHYNPHTKELVIKKEAVEKRLATGAQPSNSVAKLLVREKIELPKWVTVKTRDRKPKKEHEPASEVAPAATEAEAEQLEAKVPIAKEDNVTEKASDSDKPEADTEASPADKKA